MVWSKSWRVTWPIMQLLMGQTISGVSVILLLRALRVDPLPLQGLKPSPIRFLSLRNQKQRMQPLPWPLWLWFWGSCLQGLPSSITGWVSFQLKDNNSSPNGPNHLREFPVGQAFFYVFQLSTALILAVAANTGFSAFPMLAFNMAKINTCHTCIWKKGSSGPSNGILTLAIGAIVLLLIFDGQTESLIPLYTIGLYSFCPFSNRDGDPLETPISKGFLKYSLANILGAAICYGIVLILLLFRLREIWPFFPIIGLLLWMFLSIRNHYDKVALNCAWEVRSKRQVMRAIPWLSLLGMSLR